MCNKNYSQVVWLVFGLLWLMALPTWASGPDNPFQASVPVADTSVAARADGFASALDRVMSQVGNVSFYSVLGADSAQTYVRSYRYQETSSGASFPYLLTVTFAADAVKQLIREAKQPTSRSKESDQGNSASLPVVQGNSQQVHINGVDSALDFAGIWKTIHNLQGVTNANVARANGAQMIWYIQTSLSRQQLLGLLEDSGHFVVHDTFSSPESNALTWQK